MLGAAELALTVASALVFGVAGGLKVREDAPRWRLFGGVELLTAAAILVPVSRPVGLAAGLALGIGFTGYALLTAEKPCRCFGARFQASSRNARMLRALGVAATCGGALAAWASSGSAGSEWWATALVVGLALGGAIIVLPAALSGPARAATGAFEGRANV